MGSKRDNSKASQSLIKLPGLVDVHVHLREPGATQKEDFETGTKAAIAGGYTQIIDMPNNPLPTVTDKTLSEKVNLAKNRIWCDLGFNFGGTKESMGFFPKVKSKTFGLKVYMNRTTGPLLVENNEERERIFKFWKSKQPIMVHAEGDTIKIAIKLAKKYGRRLHICHITSDQLDKIRKAKKGKVKISCEVTPHHLFLSTDNLKSLGPYGLMKPPLEKEKNRGLIWENLDVIDMASTDHAPHTKKEKLEDPPKFGVPGLETTLKLFLQAEKEGKITLKKITELLCTNPRKIFNIPKQTNTYIIVDTQLSAKITNKNLETKCKWTPFVGKTATGKIKKVVIRGKTIFENGRFVGKPHGKVIYPT